MRNKVNAARRSTMLWTYNWNSRFKFHWKEQPLKTFIANSLTSFEVLRLHVHVFERPVGYHSCLSKSNACQWISLDITEREPKMMFPTHLGKCHLHKSRRTFFCTPWPALCYELGCKEKESNEECWTHHNCTRFPFSNPTSRSSSRTFPSYQ